jgi:putative transposase
MPTKNSVKTYVVNGVYHIYNRGVEKRKIFLDDRDYDTFLYYLRSYLLPLDKQAKPPLGIKRLNNFTLCNEINLIAYVLMPTHFHLMIKQKPEKAITEFMKRLSNGYVEYFNKRYERVGALFQGRYKAVLINDDDYFLHLTRYLHLNPLELFSKEEQVFTTLRNYQYSSYPDYIGARPSSWLKKDTIMKYFQDTQDKLGFSTYQEFVEQYAIECREVLGNCTID